MIQITPDRIHIESDGISLIHRKQKICIQFSACAKNYAADNSIEISTCVGTRDVTALSFIFYTTPKVKVLFKKHFIKELIPGMSAFNKFRQMQKIITQLGYTSYDLS